LVWRIAKMNLANKTTLLRGALNGLLLLFASFLNFYSIFIATILGIIICLSDLLDGYIAKKYKLTTDFGRIADPIVDKIFCLIAFTFFLSIGMMPFPIVAIILARGILAGGARILAAKAGRIIEADIWGKTKTYFQGITLLLFALTLLHHLYVRDFQATGIINEEFVKATILNPLLYLTLAVSVLSVINYIYCNREVLFKDF